MCIDERVSTLDNCIKNIKKYSNNIDILGIIRYKDKICEQIFKKYNIKILYVNNNRHNLHDIALKRTQVLQYAKQNNYSILIFIDADININYYTLKWIIYGIQLLNADIVCVPYNIVWPNNNDPVLGYINPVEIRKVKFSFLPYHKWVVQE